MLIPHRLVASVLALLTLGAMFSAASAWAQCENPTVSYQVLVSALEREASSEPVALTIVPLDDEGATPVVAEVSLGERTSVEGPSGAVSLTFERTGSETRVLERDTCRDASVSLTLVPDSLSTLDGRVFLNIGDDPAASAGAEVILRGEGQRAGIVFTEEVGEDGRYRIEEMPAGVYRLRVDYEDSESTQRFDRSGIDLLSDGTVTVRLRSSADLPEVEEGCATSSMPGSPFGLLVMLGLLLTRIRTRLWHG